MPRVTVCIPTYKRTRWLADTIASALGQTFTDLVVEVHDDATPGDAVARVVEQFDDPRLRLIAHERNAGIVGNFTRSLLGAETEYVLQLGDDDVADPRLVEATVAALDAHPTAGVAHARFAIIDDAGATLDPDQDWLGTPSPPLESGAAFVERSMHHGCRDLQFDGADPAGRSAGRRDSGSRTTRSSTSRSGCGWPSAGTSRSCPSRSAATACTRTATRRR